MQTCEYSICVSILSSSSKALCLIQFLLLGILFYLNYVFFTSILKVLPLLESEREIRVYFLSF